MTKTKHRFIFDQNKCVGCQACVLGCNIENGIDSPMRWREISTMNPVQYPNLSLFNFSLACNHCEEAVCMNNCPANAYTRDSISGAVVLNSDNCIGCQYCTWTCPYDAPKYNAKKGTTEKCTFCYSRLNEGQQPACIQACPTGALGIEAKTENIATEQFGLANFELRPSLRIIPLQAQHKQGPTVAETANYDMLKLLNAERKPKEKINAKHEWPLISFTIGVPFLVAWFASQNMLASTTQIISFFIINGLLTLLSVLHLGRKERAFRAILNLKQSWLSREIFFFGAFSVFSFCYLVLFPSPLLFYPALLSGIFTLVSIDQLYSKILPRSNALLHSASALSSGFLFYGLLANNIVLMAVAINLKLILLVQRTAHSKKWILPTTRTVLALVAFVLFVILPTPYIGIFLFIVSESIDRISFYQDLNVPSPQGTLNVLSDTIFNEQSSISSLEAKAYKDSA